MARPAVTVAGYLAALDPERRAQVEAVRAIVRDAAPGAVEIVKWNAPSWVHDGEDRLTLSTAGRAGLVRLVLHMGTTRAEDRTAPPVLTDPTGLVAWSSDIRGVITCSGPAGVEAQRDAVADLVRRWLAIPVRGDG